MRQAAYTYLRMRTRLYEAMGGVLGRAEGLSRRWNGQILHNF
jgi:hypothetical protein